MPVSVEARDQHHAPSSIAPRFILGGQGVVVCLRNVPQRLMYLGRLLNLQEVENHWRKYVTSWEL